jgi:hypothetical protein
MTSGLTGIGEHEVKLGVNALTDEALEKLRSLNVAVKREETVPNARYWAIYTEAYDLAEEAWRDGPWDWLEFPGDKEEYATQGFRTWKHPETGDYYLWIKGTVFRKYSKITKDYSTSPPTQFTFDVIDYDPADDSYRDKLLSIMPMAQSMFFQ